MATTRKLKVNGKEYTVQVNNNNQISGVVQNGTMVLDTQDPLVETLKKMARYDDGQKYSKPQPKVKIGDEIIKLGNRYMTEAEKLAVKDYTKEHLTGEGRTSSGGGHDKDTFDKLTEIIDKYSKKKEMEPLVKELQEMRKFYFGCLSKTDLMELALKAL